MELAPWEKLKKEMLWRQLAFLQGRRVLDFGSGHGITANHLAKTNTVTAVEPDTAMLEAAVNDAGYNQIIGGAEVLAQFADGAFDAVVCHNVLEYVPGRAAVVREFARMLAPGGTLSLCKHNRAGRVMQMVVLLNDFAHARQLLAGEDGHSQQFGEISYYDDGDIEKWDGRFCLEQCYGLRTFWHLQQNQEIQKDPLWQAEMLEMEGRVSTLEDYRRVAMFHHLLFKKSEEER